MAIFHPLPPTTGKFENWIRTDQLSVPESNAHENTEVVIYNRWGAKVYQSLGYKQAWDGRNFAGDLVKEGVYFYSIILKNGHDNIKGSVSVFYWLSIHLIG